MATISILADRARPSVDRRPDDTAFGAGTFSWQDPVHSWKAGPGEVMIVENLFMRGKGSSWNQDQQLSYLLTFGLLTEI